MSTTKANMARQQNRDALHGQSQKDIGLAELDGFQLAPQTTEEFLDRMQNEITILGMADTMMLERLEVDVPQFGVPLLSGNTRDEEGTRTANSAAASGEVKFNVTDKQYYVLVEPKRDALKNTHYGPDAFGDYIVGEFVQRWANDVGLIGIRAGASSEDLQSSFSSVSSSDLDDTWDGWIARAEDDTQSDDGSSTRIGLEDTAGGELSSMPVYDQANAAPDTQMFNDTIQTLDQRYRDPDDVVFLCSPNKVQEYHFNLTQREDIGGAAVLMGDGDVTPFDYDVIPVNGWPDSYGMFTDPSNLAYGLYRDMTLDQTTDSDTVHENVLHSRNWLEGQFDFQIKEMQAGVLITNIG